MRLIEVYAEEFGEVYERVSGLLLDLESAAPGPDRAALVEQLQRALHGAKGGALVIPELKEVAGFVHAAEDYLAAVPTEGSLAAGLFDPVFRGLDGAREVVDAILHETPPPGLQAFIAALSPQVAEAIAPASDAEAEPAAPAPVSVAAPPPAAEGPPASDADGGGSEAGDPEEAAEAGSAPGTTVGKPAGGDTVRVAVAELDVLIRSLGGLATSREGVARVSQTLDAISTALGLALRAEAPDTAALTELHGQLDTLSREARQVQHQLVRSSRAVQDAALRLRMQPFSAAFPFVRRAARDVQRRTGRDARLVLEGATS